MEKIMFKKGIKKIYFPITPEYDGESIKEINKFLKRKDLPKFNAIGFNREIGLKKGFEYDGTEIYIIK
jgi:hypothetical protein